MIKPRKNELLLDLDDFDPHADIEEVENAVLRKTQHTKREIKDLRRAKSAIEAIGTIDKETEIFGFTKGQFSFVDLINAVLKTTGPAKLQVSTWTAAKADMGQIHSLLKSGTVTETRWLVDYTFIRRSPGIYKNLIDLFGRESVRVSKNHAKFATIENEDWKVVIRTSMNLNMNPRFEDFTVAHDVELFDFLGGILDQLFKKGVAKNDQDDSEHRKGFKEN